MDLVIVCGVLTITIGILGIYLHRKGKFLNS